MAALVADQRRGIYAESLSRLFRNLAHHEGDDSDGDTGLGLAICQG